MSGPGATIGMEMRNVAARECAPPTGSTWLIPLTGFGHALPGFIGLITARYRKRQQARSPP